MPTIPVPANLAPVDWNIPDAEGGDDAVHRQELRTVLNRSRPATVCPDDFNPAGGRDFGDETDAPRGI
jgi:hypothetical protein